MTRLSLSMIVKNEESRLAHCLESVQGLVDEVVILDTGSEDQTQAIARSLGAQVFPFRWVDDFSQARNSAIARCTGDWILVLDADESIDRLDHEAIRNAMEQDGAVAYRLWIREYFKSGAFIGISGPVQRNDDRYSEGSAFSHRQSYQAVRLFRTQQEQVFQGRVHELAEQFFQERGLPILDLDASIHHFGKVDDQRETAKQLAYTRLAKLEAQAHPGDAMAHYNVVQQALTVEDWDAVLSSAQAYLELVDRVPMMIYLGAAQALMRLGRCGEAMTYLEAMLSSQPGHVAALDAKGEALWRMGRSEEAQACFLIAMETEPGFTLPYIHLARMLDEQGNTSMARSVLEVGLDQNPQDLVLWTTLVGHSAAHDPIRAATDAWDAIQVLPGEGEGIWHLIVIHALLAQNEMVDAARVLEMGRRAFPLNGELRAMADRLAR